MHVYSLQRQQLVPLTPAETFEFFADAFNLEAIKPPWLGFEVATPGPIAMGAGALIEYRLKLHALPLSWLTRIEAWEPGRRFADFQRCRASDRKPFSTSLASSSPVGTE